jgi:hypothetical protein
VNWGYWATVFQLEPLEDLEKCSIVSVPANSSRKIESFAARKNNSRISSVMHLPHSTKPINHQKSQRSSGVCLQAFRIWRRLILLDWNSKESKLADSGSQELELDLQSQISWLDLKSQGHVPKVTQASLRLSDGALEAFQLSLSWQHHSG